jgi:hypothetical protein
MLCRIDVCHEGRMRKDCGKQEERILRAHHIWVRRGRSKVFWVPQAKDDGISICIFVRLAEESFSAFKIAIIHAMDEPSV